MKIENTLNDFPEIKGISDNISIRIDLITSLIGSHVGSGISRAVFNYNLDERYVIKLEYTDTHNNAVEWMAWNEIKNLTGDLAWVKDWFAPVGWISPNGRIMTMRKVKKIPNRKKPDRIPEFLWDVKEENFGWLGNKFVCVDYGQFYNFVNYSKKFKKVAW